VSYTLLTGMHLPTVRACTGALLVLAAMLLGRQPLSLRLLAAAAVAVMLLWPEEVIGPSFQMSFGSVIAIIALHGAAPAHAFLAHRPEPWWRRLGRHLAMLLLSGMVIDLALMPVALFHFHRAGVFGSLANLIAIPLVTFVAMPAIAAGLVLDIVHAGAPAWWVVGHSLELLLAVTHWIVARPGAVSLLPTMTGGTYALFVGGMVWLGLWRGKVRLLGLVPPLLATAQLASLHPPDMLITGDGRNLGIANDNGDLLVLRMGRSAYTREMFLELTGLTGKVAPLESWPGAHCNHDFCAVDLSRGGRIWRVLVARNEAMVPYAEMARACASVDIVVAERKLYGPCNPALLKADKALLMRTGGLALDLTGGRITSVEDGEGEHPWWRAPHRLPAHADDDWTIAPSGMPPGEAPEGEGSSAGRLPAVLAGASGPATPTRPLSSDSPAATPRASDGGHARR
jgi:competence protein ComEC